MKKFGPYTFHQKPKDWKTRKQWEREGRFVLEGESPVGMMSGAHGSTKEHFYFARHQTALIEDLQRLEREAHQAEETVREELVRRLLIA